MTTRWIVSIAQIRKFQEESPEYLTSAHCAVYDTAGNETIIKGYRLDSMLERGFLEEPPSGVVSAEPEPLVTMPAGIGIRSARVMPRRRPLTVGRSE